MAKKMGFVGRAFHTLTVSGRTQMQGKFIAERDGYLLAQLYSWNQREETVQVLFQISEIASRHDNGQAKFILFNEPESAKRFYANFAKLRDAEIDNEASTETAQIKALRGEVSDLCDGVNALRGETTGLRDEVTDLRDLVAIVRRSRRVKK